MSFTQTLALPVALSRHSAPAKEHPEVVLLPVGLNLRFNIVRDLQKLNILLLNMISDEVMSDVNVLCSCVLNRILGKADSACVIT